MTQPVDPTVYDPGAGPTAPPESIEEYMARPQVPLAHPVAPVASASAAPEAETSAQLIAKLDRQREEYAREQARLEEANPAWQAVATKYAKGFLGAMVAPGAFAAAGLESLGDVTGSQTLRDFGRGLGESSTGTAALQTLREVFNPETEKLAPGQYAETPSTRMARILHEQQRAWPTLSTVSEIAGAVGYAVTAGAGAGSLASGEAALTEAGMHGAHMTTAARMILGGTEAGAMSASAAYEHHAPLRDVLSSMLIGSALGAAVGGAPAVLSRIKLENTMGRFANRQTIKALGGTPSDAKKIAQMWNKDIASVAETTRNFKFPDGRGIFNLRDDLGTTASLVREAREEVGKQIGALRTGADAVIDAVPEVAPNVRQVIQRVKSEVIEPLENAAGNPERAYAKRLYKWVDDLERQIPQGQETGKVGKLYEVYDSIESQIYKKSRETFGLGVQSPPSFMEAERKIGRIINDGIEDSVLKAEKYMNDPLSYTKLKTDYGNLDVALKISRSAAAANALKNTFGIGDLVVGGSTLAGSIAGGAGLLSGGYGLAATLIYKALRAKAPGYLAKTVARMASEGNVGAGQSLLQRAWQYGEHGVGHGVHGAVEATIMGHASEAVADVLGKQLGEHMARRPGAFASAREGAATELLGQAGQLTRILGPRETPQVPMTLAGGRESQEVMTAVQRAKQHVQRAEAEAGDNPDQRQQARQHAQEQMATDLAHRAGPYNAQRWHEQPPTPLQKALHRPEILDHVARDVAADVSATPLYPSIDLDLEKIKRLTRDADGPAAIGGAQNAIQGALQQTPPTVEGYGLGFEMRRIREQMTSADVAQTMMLGHELVSKLEQTSATSADPTMRQWSARQAASLRGALGNEVFGAAGIAYGAAIPASVEDYHALADPETVREQLRTAQSKGFLVKPLLDQRAADVHAASAAEMLGASKGRVRELTEHYESLRDKFAKAEDAVTFDGSSAGRIVDFFHDQLDNRMTQRLGDDITQVTANAVRPRLTALAPVIAGRLDKNRALEPQRRMTRSAAAEFHRDRLEMLAEVLGDEDTMEGIQAGLQAFPRMPEEFKDGIAGHTHELLSRLYADLPKPHETLHGSGFDSLSSDDLRKASAMWEATMDPMSIVDDFQHGSVDYDKVAYVKTQYPGLLFATQAGVMDMLTQQMSDRERANIAEPMLTQLDYMFGFNGTLQASVDRAFAARMEQAAQQEQQQQQPQGGGRLNLPQQNTLTQRLGRARQGRAA